MPLNEPKNQAPYQTPSTEEQPTTPAEHRQQRQKDMDATQMAQNIADGLNRAVKNGELHGL